MKEAAAALGILAIVAAIIYGGLQLAETPARVVSPEVEYIITFPTGERVSHMADTVENNGGCTVFKSKRVVTAIVCTDHIVHIAIKAAEASPEPVPERPGVPGAANTPSIAGS